MVLIVISWGEQKTGLVSRHQGQFVALYALCERGRVFQGIPDT